MQHIRRQHVWRAALGQLYLTARRHGAQFKTKDDPYSLVEADVEALSGDIQKVSVNLVEQP